MGLLQRADEGFGPYGDTVGPVHFLWGPICVSALARVTKATSPVGSDALVRPPAQAATTARAARSAAERAEGGTSGTLVTEILGAPQRETVKEKLVKCVLAPRRPPHHPPRDGSCKLAEDPSVPEGQAKSEQAPIRRPPYSNFARTCKVATKAAFSFGPCTARFLFGKTEKKMVGASPLDSPSCGSRLPPAAVRRPKKHPPCGGRSLVRMGGEGFHSPHRLFFHLMGMVTGTSASVVREKVGHSHTSS